MANGKVTRRSNAALMLSVYCAALTVAVTPLAVGCTTPYQMPPEALAVRSKLDEAGAQAIVSQALPRDAQGRGGAYLAAARHEDIYGSIPTDVHLNGRTIEYMGHGPDALTKDDLSPGCRTIHEVEGSSFITDCPFRVELDKLARIYVGPSAGDDTGHRSIPGYFIRAEQGNFQWMTLNVTKDQFIPTLAAVTYFSPGARLLQGSNF